MLHKIEFITSARAGTEKISALKGSTGIKMILQYAYDPFKKYYITAPDLKGTPGGRSFRESVNSMFYLLEQLSKREISGQLAVEAVHDEIVSLDPSTAELFKRILNKDLRCGINVKTINAAFPGLILTSFDGTNKPDIMLVKNFNEKKVKFPLVAAVKKDGVRGRYPGQLISRQGHRLIGLDHIESELYRYPHELDGELMVPGEIFDVASGLIRNHNDVPNAEYWVFDCPSHQGDKWQRYIHLRDTLPRSQSIKLIRHHLIKDMDHLRSFYEWAIDKGEEGIVIYRLDSKYIDGKTNDWMRMVPLEQADCKVIGFYEGKGKFAGTLGGIIVDYKGHACRVGTGFTEKSWKDLTQTQRENLEFKEGYQSYVNRCRNYIWENRNEHFLGAIAQCEFKEETKAGSMRQPRFKRWRWDK